MVRHSICIAGVAWVEPGLLSVVGSHGMAAKVKLLSTVCGNFGRNAQNQSIGSPLKQSNRNSISSAGRSNNDYTT